MLVKYVEIDPGADSEMTIGNTYEVILEEIDEDHPNILWCQVYNDQGDEWWVLAECCEIIPNNTSEIKIMW